MIPVLKNEEEVLGFLNDALSCIVTEERNGVYELSMTYPISGQCAELIEVDRIVLAKPNDTSPDQMFRIYEVTKPISGIMTINAEHISYELSHLPITSLTVDNSNPTTVMARIMSAGASGKGYIVRQSTITTKGNFKCEATSVRGALGGTEGSVLDVFGGEFEFDNRYVQLHKNRGSSSGVIISYGKNLTDMSLTVSTESSYTALFPYARKDETLLTLSEKTIPVTNHTLAKEKVLFYDFSSEFDTDEVFNQANLRKKANAYLAANDINSPDINMTVSFQHLWQSPEYAWMEHLEKVRLCDTVKVYHEGLGIYISAKVIKTVYNTLSEHYEKLELGSAKSNFSDTLRQQQRQINAIEKNQQDNHSLITQEYMAAIDRATKAITGYEGGYIVLHPSENPQELLVLDYPEIVDADRLWRFNLGGLGYSDNGYGGPYKLALTMDGEINASMITTGTLTANIIRAGILTAVDGNAYFNVESGHLSTAYANITGGYISIGGTEYRTVIQDGSIEQYLSNRLYTGGMVPVGSGSTYSQCIYCSENSSVEGVVLSQRTSSGTFKTIGGFGKSKITLHKPTYIYDGGLHVDNSIVTGEATDSDTYTALKHWRTRAFGGSGTSVYSAMVYLGCGNISSKPSASLEVKSYGGSSGDTTQARLDIFRSSGEAYMCIRGSSVDGNSKLLELGAKAWWNGELCATKFTVSSTEDIKENISESGSVLDLFKTSKIYQYNLIEEEEAPDPYDEDDEQLAYGESSHFGKPEITLDSDDEGSIDAVEEPAVEVKESMGFVIGRETPQEVISDDGKHVDLYSMAAITWKAVQEILTRLEHLEGKDEGNN
ncbi:MAG: hypothetical protein E7571_00860 [Ruminococcaceae bacterium]|nr:hypothetical protein [Oscillospiraceae bacterium]